MNSKVSTALLTIGLFCAYTATAQHMLKGDSLQEVVVTGTGTQHLLKNAPVQTEVITHKMLQSYGGRSIEDIMSGLTASFDFNEGDMGSQMQMNGLGNSYILILVDGKRMHGDVGGENDLGLIDPHNIERIEIVKGASSALYGSDAIAGVINIITKKHDSGLLAEDVTRVGSYGDVRQHNGVGFRVGKVSSYTNFQLQHSDGWRNTSVENVEYGDVPVYDTANKTVNRYNNWQLAERLTWIPADNLEFYAEGDIYKKRIYRPSGHHPKYDVKSNDLSYNNAALSGGGKWKLGKTDFVSLDVDYNRHAYYYNYTAEKTLVDGYDQHGNFTPYFPVFRGQRVLQSDQRRMMSALKGVFTLPYGNRLSAGAEWRYDWLNAPMRVEGGKVTDNTGAIYVQDEYNPFDFLNITAGLRLTYNEQFGTRLTPKLSAMLAAGSRVRLRASWSQGFKTPTLKEQRYYYVRQMTNMIITLGNHDLKPQSSNYYSLGAEYTWQGLSLSVTGYYNRLSDMIAAVQIPLSQAPHDLVTEYLEMGLKAMQYKNMESAKTYGVDVSARYTLKDFSVGLNYSYLDTDAEVYDSSHDRLKNVTIDGMAHHKGTLFATWSHAFSPSYRLGVGIYGRMSSTRYYQIDGNGKGYQTWRLTTSHDLGHSKTMTYRLEAGIDNIFNYRDTTPHGLHLGTTTPGTTIYASVTVRFAKGKKTSTKLTNNLNQRQNEEN